MDVNQDKGSDAFKVNGDWAGQSKQLQDKFSQLTNEDMEFEPGKEDELLGRIESGLLKNREEVINIIKKVQQAPNL